MDINLFFKSVIDADTAPVVICDLEHTVVYMNPASISRYRTDITGKNIKSCHNAESGAKIDRVVAWFKESKDNNIVYTSRNEEEKKTFIWLLCVTVQARLSAITKSTNNVYAKTKEECEKLLA